MRVAYIGMEQVGDLWRRWKKCGNTYARDQAHRGSGVGGTRLGDLTPALKSPIV
jgi:hypothetical protein